MLTISLLVCLIGLLLWKVPSGASDVGAVMFSWGLLVWLLQVGGVGLGLPLR